MSFLNVDFCEVDSAAPVALSLFTSANASFKSLALTSLETRDLSPSSFAFIIKQS